MQQGKSTGFLGFVPSFKKKKKQQKSMVWETEALKITQTTISSLKKKRPKHIDICFFGPPEKQFTDSIKQLRPLYEPQSVWLLNIFMLCHVLVFILFLCFLLLSLVRVWLYIQHGVEFLGGVTQQAF